MALTGWLKAALNFSPEGSSKKKGKTTLVADQRDLAIKLKEALSSIESELAQISKQIDKCEEKDFVLLKKIQAEQGHLRTMLNRIRVGFKRSADLEQELAEWQTMLSTGDKNQAQLEKCEIIESELELRAIGAGKTRRTPKEVPVMAPEPEPRLLAEIQIEVAPEQPQTVVLAMDQATHGNESSNHLAMEPENLLLGIRQASDELARYQDPDLSNEDFVQTLRELKTLHAALKTLDRKSGYCRDRIAETRGFSKIFQSID